MIVVSILDNSITRAHTYVIVVLCVPVATHGHLPSVPLKDCITLDLNTSVKSLLTGTYIPLSLTIHEPNKDIYAYIKVTYYNTSKN